MAPITDLFKRSEYLPGEWKKITSVEVAKEAIESGKISEKFAAQIVQLFADNEKKEKEQSPTLKERFRNLFKRSSKKDKKEETAENKDMSEEHEPDGVIIITKKEAEYLEKALTEIGKKEEKWVGSEESDIEDNEEEK